jgi:hypothetical protein
VHRLYGLEGLNLRSKRPRRNLATAQLITEFNARRSDGYRPYCRAS